MFRWLTSGLLLRILTALLIVSVIPISLIYVSTQQGYQDTQVKVVDKSKRRSIKKPSRDLRHAPLFSQIPWLISWAIAKMICAFWLLKHLTRRPT